MQLDEVLLFTPIYPITKILFFVCVSLTHTGQFGYCFRICQLDKRDTLTKH